MEINKLIAEFMQKGSKSLGIYDFDGCHYRLDELKFHSSWDWLIPVVSKCYKTGDDTHQWDDLMDGMFTCDINIVYAQVVEFINQYNKNK